MDVPFYSLKYILNGEESDPVDPCYGFWRLRYQETRLSQWVQAGALFVQHRNKAVPHSEG